MADDHLPLVFLAQPPETLGYTARGGGDGAPGSPPRDRAVHAQHLRQRFDQAWAAAQNRVAQAQSARQGHYLEFLSSPGFALRTKGLEDLARGVRLLNVRSHAVDDGERTLATVYIPQGQHGRFLRKISEYEQKETKAGHPRNGPLVDSVDDIREAMVAAFWTDDPATLPGANAAWVEVWVRTASDGAASIGAFRSVAADLGIAEHADRPVIQFPERAVLLAHCDGGQLAHIVEHLDVLAELRAARQPASFFVNMAPADQAEWAADLASRVVPRDDPGVAVCILDTGVNRRHVLLSKHLSQEDQHSVREEWGSDDHGGHGTLMAGLAAYGDLAGALESGTAVEVQHRLESAKILPPTPSQNPQHLWGHVTAQGIARAEIQAPGRRRAICLAVTAEGTRDGGQPTSWSGEADQLAANPEGDQKRLLIISAGNVADPNEWRTYPDSNVTNEVHDPAQAWNALTVGAFTEKILITEPGLQGYTPVAEAGQISPYSTTSCVWAQAWPIKPDVMLEGGNVAKDAYDHVYAADELALVSTYYLPAEAQFARFEATSAAAAQCAWMAAQILVEYPGLWPETVRGLIVHSAEWSPGMRSQFGAAATKASYRTLVRACGYGVPSLTRALQCQSNSLTLVAEAEIQPFDRGNTGSIGSKDMHLYVLPWPREALLDLGSTPVEMRVTLSYFVEPGPGRIGWRDRYRYPSHGLRFELNTPTETREAFLSRVNARDSDAEESETGASGPAGHWTLGSKLRDTGSLHSDVWRGTAAELSTSNMIAIRPTIGWWRERHHLGRWSSVCRYSLIVSIRTPSDDVDIYSEVATQIAVPQAVSVPVPT